MFKSTNQNSTLATFLNAGNASAKNNRRFKQAGKPKTLLYLMADVSHSARGSKSTALYMHSLQVWKSIWKKAIPHRKLSGESLNCFLENHSFVCCRKIYSISEQQKYNFKTIFPLFTMFWVSNKFSSKPVTATTTHFFVSKEMQVFKIYIF